MNVSYQFGFVDSFLQRKFNKREKVVLYFMLLVPFCCLIGNYSLYRFLSQGLYASMAAVAILILWGQTLIEQRNKDIALLYCFIVTVAWGISLLFHLELPSIKLLYELYFASCYLALCDEAKSWIYQRFIKILSVIFFLGIIEYIFAYMGISYTWGEAVRPNSTDTHPFYWGTFNIFPIYYKNLFFRFQSITEEPGLVGTLCFFILTTLDFKKYKYQALVFLLSGILSMSLAFYLLIGLWGGLYLLFNKVKVFLYSILFVTIIYACFKQSIDQRILNRIEEGNKTERLDNRNSGKVKELYESILQDPNLFFTGIGKKTFESMKTGNSAGIVKNIVQYGFISVSLAVLAFSYMYFQYRGITYETIILLLLFLVSLYQRFDLNLSTNIIVLFGSGLFSEKYIAYNDE